MHRLAHGMSRSDGLSIRYLAPPTAPATPRIREVLSVRMSLSPFRATPMTWPTGSNRTLQSLARGFCQQHMVKTLSLPYLSGLFEDIFRPRSSIRF